MRIKDKQRFVIGVIDVIGGCACLIAKTEYQEMSPGRSSLSAVHHTSIEG